LYGQLREDQVASFSWHPVTLNASTHLSIMLRSGMFPWRCTLDYVQKWRWTAIMTLFQYKFQRQTLNAPRSMAPWLLKLHNLSCLITRAGNPRPTPCRVLANQKTYISSAVPCTSQVFRSDSPGKAVQWLARSIRESWGVLWLVIRLLSVRSDVSSSVIKAFFPSTLVSMPELSPPLPILLLLRVGGLSRLNTRAVHLGYLKVTVQEKLCSGWPGPFVKVEGVAISHSFAFSASKCLKFSYKSILPCTAFPSTLVSMLELSPSLPVLLLIRVRGLSGLNTRALPS
jgi:hypothetical protein